MKKYNVNKDKGVIVAYDAAPGNLLDEKISSLLKNVIRVIRTMDLSYFAPIKGIARLAEGDTWNEELGKKVADAKLALKYHKRIINQALYCQKVLIKMINELDAIIAKHYKKVKSIEDDYNRYFLKKGE